MRLDKFLVHWGVASRKEAAKAIGAGMVLVNGQQVKNKSMIIEAKDEVVYQGRHLPYCRHFHYAMYKKKSVVTALKDMTCPTVYADLPREALGQRVRAVGRLDKDTTGILLFTSDGELLHRLTDPKRNVARTYHVTYTGQLAADAETILKTGIALKEGHTKPAYLRRMENGEAQLTLQEGKHHEVKRLFHALGCEVTALHRLSYGPICLPPHCQAGEVWLLTDAESEMLYQEVSHYECL